MVSAYEAMHNRIAHEMHIEDCNISSDFIKTLRTLSMVKDTDPIWHKVRVEEIATMLRNIS